MVFFLNLKKNTGRADRSRRSPSVISSQILLCLVPTILLHGNARKSKLVGLTGTTVHATHELLPNPAVPSSDNFASRERP